MQIQQGFADVNGTRLYYEMAGSGHPLVLVHGFTLDTRMWDDQFEVFAEHYQVLRYDVRGFGKSALASTEPYDHSDDLKALMDHLGIDHAHIIGLSMGGGIAINFALAYPDATDTLVPVDAGCDGYRFQGEHPVLLIQRKAQQDGIDAAKELWLNHPLFIPACENPTVAARLKEMVADYSGWHLVNNNPGRIPKPYAMERLSTINVPTLIIIGERDTPNIHGIADILEERIAGTKKVVMPGVGHMSNMEDPERFNEIVLGFLAEVS